MSTTVAAMPPASTLLPDCDVVNNATDNDTVWIYSCDEDTQDLTEIIFVVLLLLAYILLILLSRRETVHKKGYMKTCGWGHPGLLFPVNMLDGYENRLAYCAVFGAMTFDLTSVLLNPYGRFTGMGLGYTLQNNPTLTMYPVLKLPLLLFQVVFCVFLFYPYFFALTSSYKFIGSVVGVILSIYKLFALIWVSTCKDMTFKPSAAEFTVNTYLLAILVWPCIICMVVLGVQYARHIVQCVRARRFGFWTLSAPVALPHHVKHVKILLGKDALPWTEKDLNHLSTFNKQKLLANFGFSPIAGFLFPTRVMATMVVTALAAYQIGMQVVYMVYAFLVFIKEFTRCAKVTHGQSVFAEVLAASSDTVILYADIMVDVWLVTMVFTSLFILFHIYHICLCYRKHTHRLYRGDRRIFPQDWSRQENHDILVSASRHPGLQIAYTMWGFVIIQVFIFMVACLIIFVLILPPARFGVWTIIYYFLQVVVASLIVNQLIYWAQLLLNRFLFLQDKIEPTDQKPPLAIDNRKGWYNISFIFFFWNLFLGVISALMRILKGLVLGVFFIPRIDRPVLMAGFETMDNGFHAYLCLLTVMNTHDHPVLKTFVKILLNSARPHSVVWEDSEWIENGQVQQRSGDSARSMKISKRAKCRWFLAYTLIHNPELIPYRKVKVESDDLDCDSSAMPKTKIAMAIQRKRQGEPASRMHASSEVVEEETLVVV